MADSKKPDHDRDNRVIIFDTTLRDGEQSPGYGMNTDQKLRMARALDELGVDVIEAGFAAASEGDAEAVQRVAAEVKNARVCSLARCHKGDISAAGRALDKAHNKRIHVFIATSPIHREHKLQLSREQVLEKAVEGVRQALSYADDVEFSAEDAIRTERDFLAQVVEAVIDAGARTVNIPDTVGYSTPDEIGSLFSYLVSNVPNVNGAILSAHCHDDLGMAVANSLAAVKAGARQIECTINGIGERAGNCSLEEAVMAIKTRADFFSALEIGVNTKKLYPTSQLLTEITGQPVARNKAIVGRNAFAHEAGIHQHGMLQNRETYEIMRPEDVGMESALVLGKHSGRHALQKKLQELGYELGDNEFQSVFIAFKDLADRQRDISDDDLIALTPVKAADQSF